MRTSVLANLDSGEAPGDSHDASSDQIVKCVDELVDVVACADQRGFEPDDIAVVRRAIIAPMADFPPPSDFANAVMAATTS